MPIHRIFQSAAVGPLDIVWFATYDNVLRRLAPANRNGAVDELVARQIVEISQRGIRDTAEICATAMKEFGAPR